MKKIAQSIVLALVGSLGLPDVHALEPARPPTVDLRGLAQAPLYFEANHGQADVAARFIARGKDCTVFLSPTEATLVLVKSGQTRRVGLKLAGANPQAAMSGVGELAGRANYFIGADAAQWNLGASLFTSIRMEQVYPGIDVVYYADQSARLEHDFLVHPGADPKQIALRITGADSVRVEAGGDLVLKIGGSEIRQHRPVIYQTVAGIRKPIAGGYRLANKITAGFWIGDYDHALPLVIDPVLTVSLSFSSYLTGQYGDAGWDIATDANGNVYVCGDTLSPFLLSKKTAQFQTTYGGSQGTYRYGDAFVAKFVPNSSNTLSLAYLTYLGGSGQDSARGIAADADGNAYVTGFTDSPNFPTAHAASKKISGRNNTPQRLYRSDAFVTKLGPQGTNLVYSTYLGGGERDAGNAIAVDSSGHAYVAGFTDSVDFPVVTNRAAGARRVVQRAMGGVQDAFVVKLGVAGTNLDFSTYLGGAGQDNALGIAVDADGDVYLTGYTVSVNFPVFPRNNSYLNGLKTTSGSYDAFFTKIFADGSSNVFSTYLGGKGTDVGLRLAVDSSASAYLTGYTYSPNFPVSGRVAGTSAWTASSGLQPDVFVTKLSPTNVAGFTIQVVATNSMFVTNQIFFTNAVYYTNYSVQFGGRGADQAFGIAVNAAGEACLSGFTTRTNFFGTNVVFGADGFYDLRSTNKISSSKDVFVALLNADATAFRFGALLGGTGSDEAHGVALDAAGNAYLVGGTTSVDFPTVHSLLPRPGGKQKSNDVFVAAIALGPFMGPASLPRKAVLRAAAVVAPTLSITTAGNGSVTLSWPASPVEWVVESSAGLSPAQWQLVGVVPTVEAGWFSVTLPATNQSGCFRLREAAVSGLKSLP